MTKDSLIFEMVHAALAASKKIMEIYETGFDVSIKDDASPLTTADIASNDIIVSRLTASFPNISILSEETADSPGRLNNPCGVFIIDPLDGTKEFIKRNGEFCVSIALAVDNKLVAGVIAVPTTGNIYYAHTGDGAYKVDFNSVDDGFTYGVGTKLCVSERCDKLVLTVSRSHNDEKTTALIKANESRIADVITAGSCLKGCLIAEGTADVLYRFGEGTKEWDTAGMQIICTEAGAIFTDIYGNELTANRADHHNHVGFRILNSPLSALDVKDILD